MIPAMGAVATTFVAGVEAIHKGFARPIGSLTQMGTIGLGQSTDACSPKINDFVPLADLNDLVFTGWDIFTDDMYAAAHNAGVLQPLRHERHLQARSLMKAGWNMDRRKPWPGSVSCQRLERRLSRCRGQFVGRPGRMLHHQSAGNS